ncbi:MAG: sigma-70 family RNA polymerase sigma factor [Spirochaetaceae bacterium]|nr:MAG: sigma-70 family RNA polymerase sigma factor [Spirochaetaceae bacterium]
MSDLSSLVCRAIEEKHGQSLAKTAFGQLVKKYQDMVFGLVYAMLRDHYLAQDVTQEAFILAYNKLDTLNHPRAFPYWLQRIARRESIKALKKRRTVALSSGNVADHESPQGDTLPEEIFEKKESRRKIQAALNNLPEGQRIPVLLYHIDGYSQAEIADFLELKINTVKKRIQRGRESMQKDLMGMFEKSLKNIRPSKDDRLIKTINLYMTFDAAAKHGQLDLLEQMLVDGVEIDARDAGGQTLLHWAVENDHVDAVRLLLKYGADSNIADRSRKTAFQLAKKRKNPAVLRLFEADETERQQKSHE